MWSWERRLLWFTSSALFSERRGHRTKSAEENPQRAVLSVQRYLGIPCGGRKRGCPQNTSRHLTSRTGPEASLGGVPGLLQRPQGLLRPGKGLCTNCVARRPAGAKTVKPRRAPQSPPTLVQDPHFIYPSRTLHASRPPRPSPWKPLHRSASRVLTATPGRALLPLRGRAARDAPWGRSGRARGGGRAGPGRAGEVALTPPCPAPSFRHWRMRTRRYRGHVTRPGPTTTRPAP